MKRLQNLVQAQVIVDWLSLYLHRRELTPLGCLMDIVRKDVD
jgi:hypothetical protein